MGKRRDDPKEKKPEAADTPVEAQETEESPEVDPEASKPLAEPEKVEPEKSQLIKVMCSEPGAMLCSADNTPLKKGEEGSWKLLRPKAAALYWMTALHCKRRQVVLLPDSPDELQVAMRRVTRRTMPAPADKAAAKKHADEIEAAIAGAESKRGQPGFRKSPRTEAPDIKLTARQYVRALSYRWEQCAGFLHEMRAKFGAGAKKVRPEWAKLWTAFRSKPVK